VTGGATQAPDFSDPLHPESDVGTVCAQAALMSLRTVHQEEPTGMRSGTIRARACTVTLDVHGASTQLGRTGKRDFRCVSLDAEAASVTPVGGQPRHDGLQERNERVGIVTSILNPRVGQ